MTPLQSIPPWAIAIILCLLIATFTECTSNVATATLFLPVLASMVRSQEDGGMLFVCFLKQRLSGSHSAGESLLRLNTLAQLCEMLRVNFF